MSERIDPATMSERIDPVVPEPLGEAPLPRRLLAEFVGTLLLVGVGSGAATVYALGPVRALANIPVQARGAGIESIFANTLADLLPVAFAFATILAVLVYALGGVSGAHFNPAVTFALAVTRRFPFGELLPYWGAQLVGGIVGALVIAGIYGQDGAAINNVDILFGAPVVTVGFVQGVLAEALITFVLVAAIMAVAVDPRAPKGWSGLIIGLALAGGILVTGAATGGSANFARSLGPLVASLLFNTGGVPWGDLLIYAIGPLIGGAAAALVYEAITGMELISPAPEPGAATSPTAEEIVETDAAVTTEPEVGTADPAAPPQERPGDSPPPVA